MTKVKICGIRNIGALDAAVSGGADFVGFVFFSLSPRHLSFAEAAGLAAHTPPEIGRVAVAVEPEDDMLEALIASVPINFLQIHGHVTNDRMAALKRRFQLPLIRAIALGGSEDIQTAIAAGEHADYLLFDAKPPGGATRPGGNAVAFDWQILKGPLFPRPWILAGGLHPGNVADAIVISGARAVDVSSGVEVAPGEKSPAAIRAFLRAAGKSPRE